jgi:hypothetical protein
MRKKDEFGEVRPAEFAEALDEAFRAVHGRAPLTGAELDAGWREDASGLRWNVVTDEWDDTCFVHLSPLRPRLTTRGDEMAPVEPSPARGISSTVEEAYRGSVSSEACLPDTQVDATRL